MTSDKKSAALIAEIFRARGFKHIVISPGSRNAPVIISFVNHTDIHSFCIVDERSAAFFACIAQQTRHTVALACTSGTAVLNYAPAIAEAFYQKIPLLVLTADRPAALIDQGDGQTIRQNKVFSNYVKASYEIPENLEDEKDFRAAQKMINKAINQTMYPSNGPVHINLPFSEPIYGQVESHQWNIQSIYPIIRTKHWNEKELSDYSNVWNTTGKKLIIAGMMEPNAAISGLLKKIMDDPSVVLLSETTSNLIHSCECQCIDKVITSIHPGEIDAFKPELLVTFGGHVVSKMVKEFLRKNKPLEHWHIDPVDYRMDTYQCLTRGIQAEPFDFFSRLSGFLKPGKSNYKKRWRERARKIEEKHQQFLSHAGYCDLKVFEAILKAIPEGSQVHLGNSTPVRYAQLFKPEKNLTFFSNRGTSGIDGTVSTAAGACYVSNQLTTLIVGDLGFFYDSNALMNHFLSRQLRIIIINNSGGGIFRFLQGPGETGHLQKFFEAKHHWTAEYISLTFGMAYLKANDLAELESALQLFYDPVYFEKPVILEIFTPNEKNAEILRCYFRYLRD